MNSASELINWFWKDVKFPYSSSDVGEPVGTCQCYTETLFKDSTDPSRMRAFMMIGVLIDQMMFTHFRDLYPDFIKSFKYPKLEAHGSGGMAKPSWFVYTMYNYDKKVDWDVVSDISKALLNSLYDWFANNGWSDEMKKFQRILKKEINLEFEKINRDKLVPIIESIEHEYN